MNAAAYLDADASALADREHTNTPTNTNRPRLTDVELTEMEYAVDLLRRAEETISDELARLQGIRLGIDWSDAHRAVSAILRMAVLLHLNVQLERARRAA